MPRKAKNSKSPEELAIWIARLIKENRIEEFYHSGAWRKLSKFVRYKLDHNECQICKEHGKYKKADSAHHRMEIKKYPQLALSIWYIDEHGERKRNIIAICEECHAKEHNRYARWQQGKKTKLNSEYTNEEWW